MSIVGIVSKETGFCVGGKLNTITWEGSADISSVSTSFLPYGGITYLINSFHYPNLK